MVENPRFSSLRVDDFTAFLLHIMNHDEQNRVTYLPKDRDLLSHDWAACRCEDWCVLDERSQATSCARGQGERHLISPSPGLTGLLSAG